MFLINFEVLIHPTLQHFSLRMSILVFNVQGDRRPVRVVKTSRCSDSSTAIYCPGSMVEHPKSK